MIEVQDHLCPSAWDEFVAGRETALFSHCTGWGENLAAVYDAPLHYLAARQRGGIGALTGILPLFRFSAPGRETRLISLPYTDAAGLVADDPATATRLLETALDLADDLGAVHVELRQAGGSVGPDAVPVRAGVWEHRPHGFKTGLVRPLEPSAEELWYSLAPKVRNQVRKARRCGCLARVGGAGLVDDFYAVFSENMRDLGSPVHSVEVFRGLFARSSLGAAVVVIYHGLQPVAAAIVLRHRATLFNPWASSLRRFRPACPNMLLYWSMLAHGVALGCRRFDFGRSSPTASTCRFKLQWGAVMEPLVWHVYSKVPHQWDPHQESLVDEAWKKMELAQARLRGPGIRRWISL